MGIKITIDTNLIKVLDLLMQKTSNARKSGLWRRVNRWMTGIVWRIFSRLGGIFGVEKWKPIAESMYTPPPGKKRFGSDGAQYGRFSGTSRPLIASGNFRASHKIIDQTPLKLIWGSNFPDFYINWIQNAGRGPRQAMPNPENPEFDTGITRIHAEFMKDTMAEIRRETGL